METIKTIPKKKHTKKTKAELLDLIDQLNAKLAQKDDELEGLDKRQSELIQQLNDKEERETVLESQLASLDVEEKNIDLADSGSKYSFRIDFYESESTNFNGKISLLSTKESANFTSIDIPEIEAFIKNYLPIDNDSREENNENAGIHQWAKNHIDIPRSIATEPETGQAVNLPQIDHISIIKEATDKITYQIHLLEKFRIRVNLVPEELDGLKKVDHTWDCVIFAKSMETGKYLKLAQVNRLMQTDSFTLNIEEHTLTPGSYRLEANMTFYGDKGQKIPVTSFKEGGFLRVYG